MLRIIVQKSAAQTEVHNRDFSSLGAARFLAKCRSAANGFIYAADGPLFHFQRTGHRWRGRQMSWQHSTARQMTERVLFVPLGHPRVTYVRAVLLCLSPVSAKEHLHSHETPHLIRRRFTIRWVAYALRMLFPHAHTHTHRRPFSPHKLRHK